MKHKHIGYAEMADDGTIQLFLRAESEDGIVGHGIMIVPPSDSEYEALKTRLEGLEPGLRVAVPAWE